MSTQQGSVLKLKDGDQTLIADTVGCTRSYANQVLTGRKPGKGAKAKRILELAAQLSKEYEQIRKNLKAAK